MLGAMREFRRLVVAVSCDDLEPGLIFLSHSVCHACLLLVGSLLRIIALGSLLMVIMGSGLLPGIHMIWVSLHFSSATFGSRLMSKELGHGGVALFWGGFTVNFWEIPTRETFPHAPGTLELARCDVTE